MSHSDGGVHQQEGCNFCRGREGLGIFPTRYAVARNGMGNAPKVKAPFNAVGRAGAKQADMMLPESKESAADSDLGTPYSMGGHFTQRLLRPGYLYAYDEARDEWTGYVVSRDSYLYPFSRDEEPPKADLSNRHFSCNSGSCDDIHLRGRFVYVRDAKNATNIWMTYSDVKWTEAVWQQYDAATFRQKHMCQFDVAKWRTGGSMDHADKLINADKWVADFCAEHSALYEETLAYLKALMPSGWDAGKVRYYLDVAKGKEDSEEAKQLLGTMPPLIKQLAGSLDEVNFGEHSGRFQAAAWAFSPQPINGMWVGIERAAMRQTLATMNNSWNFGKDRPAIFALDDPAGTAMELNSLMIQQIAEITANPDFHWKMTTAGSIQLLKSTVKQAAVNDLEHHRLVRSGSISLHRRINQLEERLEEDKARLKERLAEGDMEKVRWSKNGIKNTEFELRKYRDSLHTREQRSHLGDTKAKQVKTDAWEDYKPYYKGDKLDDFLAGDNSGQQQLADAVAPLAELLDKPYVAWLESNLLANYFVANFDPDNPCSGEVYSVLASQIINQASGRSQVAQFLHKRLQEDPANPTQWPARAALGNMRPLVSNALSIASANATDVDAMADSFLTKFESCTGDRRARLELLSDAVGSFLHQVSGTVLVLGSRALKTDSVDKNGGWLLGLLGALVKVDMPSSEIIHMQGKWNEAVAGRTLANMLSDASGSHGNKALHNRKTRRTLATLDPKQGKHYAFDGLIVTAAGSGVVSAVVERKQDALAKALQFEKGLESNARRLSTLHGGALVAGTLFSAISVTLSYEQMVHAEGKEVRATRVNFGAGLSTLLGQISDSVSKGLDKLAGRMLRFSPDSLLYTRAARLAKWLEIGGKTFGLVGGVVAGAYMVYQGGKEFLGGNEALGVVHMTLGIATIISTLILVFASGILLIIGAVIALIVVIICGVIDWLQLDDMQTWLNKSYYFGAQNPGAWYNPFVSQGDYTPYKTAFAQRQAFLTLFNGE